MNLKSSSVKIVILLSVIFGGVFWYHHVSMANSPFVVDSLLDTLDDNPGDGICDDGDGNCTLRAAIEEANSFPGTDVITIGVTGTTTAFLEYPQISETLSIVGPGVDDFEIDASALNSHNVFVVAASDNEFSGFRLSSVFEVGFVIGNSSGNNFHDFAITGRGIDAGFGLFEVIGSPDTHISDCSLSDGGLGVRVTSGSDNSSVDSCMVMSSQHSGLTTYDSSGVTFNNNTITGAGDYGMFIIFGADHTTVTNNTISDSGLGAITMGHVGGDAGLVSDNIISDNTFNGGGNGGVGMDEFVTGTIVTGNTFDDCDPAIILDGSTDIVIGGDTVGERNIIRNSGTGVNAQNTDGVVFLGNYFGVLADGETLAANTASAFFIFDNTNMTIGGVNAGEGNVISGNSTAVTADGDVGLTIIGNRIGTTANGETALPNGTGLHLTDQTNLRIGGTTVAERNIISGNTGTAIELDTITTLTILGNYIGLDGDGNAVLPNGAGITIIGGSDVIIGGDTAAERNIISGNDGDGISASGIITFSLTGNYFGVLADGETLAANNRAPLVLSESSTVTIGGDTAAERNIFVGTASKGIDIEAVEGLIITGNYAGLSVSGIKIGQLDSGIQVSDSVDVIIGGSTTGQGNIVVGADGPGIQINNVPGAEIYGNLVGTDTDGNIAVGYGNNIGIMVAMSDGVLNSNKIGGILSGQGNTIAGNGTGVGIFGVLNSGITAKSFILHNSIFSNTTGIDLFQLDPDTDDLVNFGPNTNDASDSDSGSNDYLNYPVINTVSTSTGVIDYTLDVPTGKYRVEFFKNPTDGEDAWANGSAETFLGFDLFTSAGSSHADSATFSLSDGDVITATATKCTDADCTDFEFTSEVSGVYVPISGGQDEEDAPAASSGGGSNGGGCPASWLLSDGTCKIPSSSSSSSTLLTPAVATPTSQDIPVTALTPGTCPVFVGYYRKGNKNPEIKRIQAFLNKELKLKLPTDGSYGVKTEAAVKKFQVKYQAEILDPWHPPLSNKPTGRWYKTTKMKANQLLGCEEEAVVLEDNGKVWKLLSEKLR